MIFVRVARLANPPRNCVNEEVSVMKVDLVGFSRFVVGTHKGTSYATSFVTISSAVVPVTENVEGKKLFVACTK